MTRVYLGAQELASETARRTAGTIAQARQNRDPRVTYNPGYWASELGQRELQRNQEIENEQTALQRVQGAGALESFQSVLLGDGSTIPKTPQELSDNLARASDPSQVAFADAMKPHMRARAEKAAAYAMELSDAVARGGTDRVLKSARDSYNRRFPEFPQFTPQAGMTSEQLAKAEKAKKKNDTQAQLNQYTSQLGIPDLPLMENAKGEFVVLEPIIQAGRIAAETQRKKAQDQAKIDNDREKQFAARVKDLEEISKNSQTKNPYDPLGNPVEFSEHEDRNRRVRSTFLSLRQQFEREFFPERFSNDVPTTAAPQGFQEAQSKARSQGLPLVSDEADFEDLQSQATAEGRPIIFIDSLDGKQYEVLP
jgi:hypothetical protein